MANSPRRSDRASQRNFTSVMRRTCNAAPSSEKPFSVNTVPIKRNSCSWECLFVFFFVVEIVGDEDEMNGVDLRHLELGLALGAIQNFAFFHFVFIHINLCGTLGTPYHGLSSFAEFAPRHAIGKKTRTFPRLGVLYTAMCKIRANAAAPRARARVSGAKTLFRLER